MTSRGTRTKTIGLLIVGLVVGSHLHRRRMLASPQTQSKAVQGITDDRCREHPAVPLGFSPQSYAPERKWEELYLAQPDPARCGRYLRRLTSEPHVAGTPGDRRVTDFIYGEFQRDGLHPEIVEYRVLLSYPKRISVELLRGGKKQPLQLANPEPEIRGDPDTRVSDPMARVPWNAYSPSGNLTAPVVYANYGTEEDYDQLEQLGASVRGKIVLVRYFHGYRGGKSQEAEKHGAAGVIVYSDPAEDGAAKGRVYPKGPWGPPGHFQRGAVVYDFLAPGDPLTPGWASTDSAPRIPVAESKILPKIPMVPLSALEARQILKHLHGRAAPGSWQGGLPFTYHVGNDTLKVHLALEMENRVTPIWDVIARIPGSAEPEKLVILSNHHDAWVYGAVDPASGTASMLEAARAFGELLKDGFRPRRTIVFGSWDAEEYTLTGSTEWGEQFERELKQNGVVCLNVDSATSGRNFAASAVPALIPALMDATAAVVDPATGATVYERWKGSRTVGDIRSYALPGAGGPVPFGILGGGSDFMVFLQHNGVPSADMIFDGPYGVYHSLYDDYSWMERFGDPGFRYHSAMSRLWGLLAMRFADADVLPFDYSMYAREIIAYLRSLEKLAPADFYASEVQALIAKAHAWGQAASRVTDELESLQHGRGSPEGRAVTANAALMAQERALLEADGIPNRPWFRHLIYAPLPSYDAETLPGLREALQAKDLERARSQADALGRALDRATAALQMK
jgi:N-acetylated-alpha-linked acidic dipeptidase